MEKAYSYIRFSTPEQSKGDSLRRQEEMAREYCLKHGLTMDDSLNLHDKGLSAFRGTHRSKGALGVFMELVRTGQITPGSILIIENLDRLSREVPTESLSLFLDIIKAEITLVILDRNKEITMKSFNENMGDLYETIGEIRRAHEESKRKSMLIKAAWAQKRKLAYEGKLKMTARCPFWLTLSEDKTTFHVIPEVVEAIHMLFHKKLEGKGIVRIGIEMNDIPTVWKPPKTKQNMHGGWQKSYINKLLRDRSLLGEFTPRTPRMNREKHNDEPIPDYYPKVIDEDLFNAVYNLIKDNKVNHKGGRINKARNVFTGLAFCGECGGKIYYFGSHYQYFHCNNSRYNNPNDPCNARPVSYKEFLRVFMNDFEEISPADLTEDKTETQLEVQRLRLQVESRRTELDKLESKIINLMEMAEDEPDRKERNKIIDRRKERITQRDETRGLIHEMEQKITALQKNGNELRKGIKDAISVYSLLVDEKDAIKQEAMRFKLRSLIRKIVEKITLFTLTEPYSKTPVEVEPGIFKTFHSSSIDRIRIKFTGAKKVRLILLKRFVDANT